jgi:hypothetical protein
VRASRIRIRFASGSADERLEARRRHRACPAEGRVLGPAAASQGARRRRQPRPGSAHHYDPIVAIPNAPIRAKANRWVCRCAHKPAPLIESISFVMRSAAST